jgi:hypothetical protein
MNNNEYDKTLLSGAYYLLVQMRDDDHHFWEVPTSYSDVRHSHLLALSGKGTPFGQAVPVPEVATHPPCRDTPVFCTGREFQRESNI